MAAFYKFKLNPTCPNLPLLAPTCPYLPLLAPTCPNLPLLAQACLGLPLFIILRSIYKFKVRYGVGAIMFNLARTSL